ncbi:MAG: hypothetical protein R3C13_09035 [Hyphomonas sp.]|uniref:hypothetical protein n=1 Tax=Hyphomonas sp. TaxID=87 RepID=UPI003526EEDD
MLSPSRLALPLLALLAGLAGCSASGTDRPRTEEDRTALLSDAAIAADARNVLLGQLDLYEAGADARRSAPFAAMLAQMGREDLIEPEETAALTRCGQRWVDPALVLRETARSYQAVIVADDPGTPAHHAFLAQLVEELAPMGFSVFAPDGFGLSGQAQADAALPLLSDGLPLREPMAGRLVRRAKAAGLRVVSFEPTATQALQVARLPMAEQGGMDAEIRADNLYVQVFQQHPDARVIVQTRSPAAAVALAGRLRDRAGIKALSVVQADCAGRPGASVAMRPFGGVAGLVEAPDFLVGHPAEPWKRGRPDWRRRAGDVAVDMPDAFQTSRLPLIVEARRVGEPAGTVPEDRLLLRPGEVLPLMLPPGDYRLEAWTKNGEYAAPQSIRVAGTP